MEILKKTVSIFFISFFLLTSTLLASPYGEGNYGEDLYSQTTPQTPPQAPTTAIPSGSVILTPALLAELNTPTPDTSACRPGDNFSPLTGAQCPSGSSTPPTPSTPGTPSPYTFTRSLSQRMSGEDVKQLQIFLNRNGFLVAPSGVGLPAQAGSAGFETTYFGPATRAALINFQRAKNIAPAVGFFGPITRNVVNGL